MGVCMRIWRHDVCKPKKWNGEPCKYMDVKLDGWRLTIFVQERGPIALTAKQDLTEYCRRYEWWKKLQNLPPYTSVDGELIATNQPSSYVKSALLKGEPVEFHPFCIPYLEGKSCKHHSPDWSIKMFEKLRWHHVDHWELSGDETEDLILSWAKKRGYEGFVLKKYNYDGWYKVKVLNTVDCFVTALVPGIRAVGSVRVAVFDNGNVVEIGTVSGFSNDELYALSKNDFGRVLECQCQGVASRGKLRHARFVRWRDDLERIDCTMEKINAT